MQCNLAPPDMPKCYAQRKQKVRSKQCRCRRLIHASDGRHPKAHHESRNSYHQPACNINSPAQPVPAQMPRPNAGTELERPQNHEKQSRHNMNESEYRIVRKQVVQGRELRHPRIGRRNRRMIAMHQNRRDGTHSPRSNRNSNRRQKNDAEPNCPLSSSSHLHTCYYVRPFLRLSIPSEFELSGDRPYPSAKFDSLHA